MTDPDVIEREWELEPDSNVGALCGPDSLDGRGLVIIDIDQPDGPKAFAGLQDQFGRLPVTPTVRTPNGGFHVWLTGHIVSWDPAPGLEVRSGGRQCAAPPSVLRDGQERLTSYEWLEGRELGSCEIAELPLWWQPPVLSPKTRKTFVPDPDKFRDPVLEVPPPRYFEALTGLTRDRQGFVSCPVHPFVDTEPSCKVWDSAERGWYCFGESCRRGGDVVSLAANLAGVPTPVKGTAFVALLDYLAGRLL
jgi:hypothetical protein